MELKIQIYYYVILLVLLLFLINCERDEIAPFNPFNDSDCNVENVVYNDVREILQNDCTGCHDNSISLAGVNLEGYENVLKYAENGELLNSLNQSMKPYLSDDCSYFVIQSWIMNEIAEKNLQALL